MKKIILLVVIVAVGFVVFSKKQDEPLLNNPVTATSTTATTTNNKPAQVQPAKVIAENLKIPWDIAFLPGGDILVTERPGTLLRITPQGTRTQIPISGVKTVGEGGLLGLVLHPDFQSNQFLYIYLGTPVGNGTQNRVERYKLEGNTLTDKKVIISGIPGAIYHDGGRMEFGPDGYLYITTGDATSEKIAQDKNSLGGKILRLKDDGSILADNPFGSAVYSYGHRNPQGLAWDDQGRLWSTEHGRSGVQSGMDEVNLIVKGGNYGWPNIEGDKTAVGMINPAWHSGASETWAPASALYYKGAIYFGGLKGEGLYKATLDGDKVTKVDKYFSKEFGRIRTVRMGPDNMFYITTSNTDGRGSVGNGYDKIIKIDPNSIK